jgi:hypothetical protein
VLLAALGAASAPAAPREDPAPAVTCATHARSHELVIHAHELRQRIHFPSRLLRHFSARERRQLRRLERQIHRTPAEIAIERRIDEITVLDNTTSPFDFDPFAAEQHGALRSCGAPPTVDGVDAVVVELGKHSRSANLNLDLRFGTLAPGATDEGDGGSEIELDGRLGDGYAEVQLTRGNDSVLAKRLGNARDPGPTTVNLNAAEASPDADLELGHHSPVLIDGGGGNDSLSSAGGPADPDDDPGVLLVGGQGDDRLTGGAGSDALVDAPGDDRIKAGAGSDAVISFGHGRDHVDCGPAFDLALVASLDGVRHCEKVLTPEDVDLRGFDVEQIEPGKLRRRLPAGKARFAVMRMVHSLRAH